MSKKVKEEEVPSLIEDLVTIISSKKIVDWEYNIRVKREVLIGIEDFLLDDIDIDFTKKKHLR